MVACGRLAEGFRRAPMHSRNAREGGTAKVLRRKVQQLALGGELSRSQYHIRTCLFSVCTALSSPNPKKTCFPIAAKRSRERFFFLVWGASSSAACTIAEGAVAFVARVLRSRLLSAGQARGELQKSRAAGGMRELLLAASAGALLFGAARAWRLTERHKKKRGGGKQR